jgi:hypothetical protein
MYPFFITNENLRSNIVDFLKKGTPQYFSFIFIYFCQNCLYFSFIIKFKVRI